MQGDKITQRIKGPSPVAYILVVLIMIFSVMSPNYLTLMNFKNVLIQATPLTTAAFKWTCIVPTQGTDLSLGAQVSFITVSTAWVASWGIPLPAVMLLAILSTVPIGVVSGVIIAKGSIPSLIATYGVQNILSSFSLLLAVGSSIYFQSLIYRIIAEAIILEIPLTVWVAVLVFIMAWVVLNKTRLGVDTHGLDGNRGVLQLTGTNPITCLIKTYASVGFIAGIAGVITFSRIEVGVPTVTMGWGSQVVTVTLLGGTSLREGKGGVTGTAFGVLLIQVVKDGLNVVGMQSIEQNAVADSIVLITTITDVVVRTRLKEQRGRDMKAEGIFGGIRNSKVFYSLVGLIIPVTFSAVTAPNSRTVDNTITVFRWASVLPVFNTGLTVVLLTGGMDLFVGATTGFIGCICAQCIRNGVSVPAAFTLRILIELVVGAVNGLLAGIPPSSIATYGTSWVTSGLVALVMQGAVIYDLPKGLTRIGVRCTDSVPNLTIIAAVVVALIYILLQKTTYGRQVYVYGSNPVTTKYTTTPAKKIMLPIPMMYNICAGLVGMLTAARSNAADAAMGGSYGLQIVATVMVDGTSMLGEEGGILGTTVGASILTTIANVVSLEGISSYAQRPAVGTVIIAMALFDTCSRRKQENKVIQLPDTSRDWNCLWNVPWQL